MSVTKTSWALHPCEGLKAALPPQITSISRGTGYISGLPRNLRKGLQYFLVTLIRDEASATAALER